jgi:hypothetical protein
MADYINAHRKAILALVGLLAIQFLDSDTADWCILVADTILVLLVPNDVEAKARVWGRA